MIKSLNLKNTQTVGTDVSFQELLKAFEDIDSGYANLRALNNQNECRSGFVHIFWDLTSRVIPLDGRHRLSKVWVSC